MGEHTERVALTGVAQGRDFEVVVVCMPDEVAAAAISPEDAAQVREDAAKRTPADERRDDAPSDDDTMVRAAARAAEVFGALGLVGMDVDTARGTVEAAGGEFKVQGEAMTFKLTHNRVTASVQDGRVTDFWTG